MPTSATGRRTDRRAARGLTLVELLAVVAILAVLALPLTLRLRPAPDPLVQAEALLLAGIEAARDRALYAGAAVALEGRADGWAAVGAAAVKLDGLAADWRPAALRFHPDRSGTPFEVRLAGTGAVRVCRFAGRGGVACADR
jgi:prepilin-type N-terminal cleavage/methylation domain-containing protein